MERIPYGPPLALHGVAMDTGGACCPGAPRFGIPFHVDATAYLDSADLAHGRLHYFPFRGHLGVCDYAFEPAFIRKRNERERHRVRCVNEGYARLREHLPHKFDDKRLSKVETLRAAIGYIRHLQGLLGVNASRVDVTPEEARRTECGGSSSSDGEYRGASSDSGETV